MADVLQRSSNHASVLWVGRRWEIVPLYLWFEQDVTGGSGRASVGVEINGSRCP